MRFIKGEVYHIYNRGNENQTLFHCREHYLHFLGKIHYYLSPCSDILNWLLLRDRFHLTIHARSKTCEHIPGAIIPIQQFSESIRLLLSGYTRSINKERKRTGNLFQQRTKSVCLSRLKYNSVASEMEVHLQSEIPFERYAFKYIHQLAFRSGCVDKLEDWEFSSFLEYAGKRTSGLCNKEVAYRLLDLDEDCFGEGAYEEIPQEIINLFFQTQKNNWSDTF